LNNRIREIPVFLKTNKIDILEILESRTTEQSVIKVPYCTVYYANYYDGTAHAGSALLIKSQLKHCVVEPYITNKTQRAIIKLEFMIRPIRIAEIYSPPKHTISCQEYENFLLQLGPHFLVAGVWNAKHTARGSRLITPKDKTLLNVIQQSKLNYMSTGEPTYWPTDLNKTPDLLDFAITKSISDIYTFIQSNLDNHQATARS
jgi:hypothetical protein